MQKEVILLVGAMGSGKSTLCSTKYSTYYRISQDEQGRKEHYEEYLRAIKRDEPRIIIDRLNHLASQRRKYIIPAQEKGYCTRIVVINEPFDVCLSRILKRENHPNLSHITDKEVVLKALRMYVKEYQRPASDEAHSVEFLSGYDPYMLDLSQKYSKFLLIGDVHGCYDELQELIDEQYHLKNIDSTTAIIFLGDLVDKGPKIKETLKLFNSLKESLKNVYTILGNHEDKLKRYLRGNNVSITHGLDKTIEQLHLEDIQSKYAQELLLQLESLPYTIKLSSNDYVVHGGINPLRSIEKQSKHLTLYIRTFNLKTLEYSNDEDPFWFELYDLKRENIYFGHNYNEEFQVKENVFSLDGYCVYGRELRAMVVDIKANKRDFFRVQAKRKYCESEAEESTQHILQPYEKLVSEGYLRKSETKDVVLYNYTQKTTFESYWNSHTVKARGLIFNKKTQEIVARPFVKFFNLGENEETQLKNLPLKFKYESYEKVDGSLGIVYWFNNSWNVATRGSLNSEQAIEGQEILKEYDVSYLNKNYTYLVEIVYPQNKIIVDYKDKRELVLLGANCVLEDVELSYDELMDVSLKTTMPCVRRYEYTIDEMIRLQKTLSKDEEGFVVRFENGLRVKIKGEGYVHLAKIIANISPLSLWEVMKNGKVPTQYLEQIPEEIMPEIESLVEELQRQYMIIKKQIEDEISKLPININQEITPRIRKEIGVHIKENKLKYNHFGIFFPYILGNEESVDEYVLKVIRPEGNNLRQI